MQVYARGTRHQKKGRWGSHPRGVCDTDPTWGGSNRMRGGGSEAGKAVLTLYSSDHLLTCSLQDLRGFDRE
eukprot:1242726-Prymnesium_polylepis.2